MAFLHLNTAGQLGNPDLVMLDEFVEGILIKSYLVCFGRRVGALYPTDARIRMTETRTGLRLSDLLGNTKNMLMVSSRLRKVIEEVCRDVEIEYLPFTIIDHRGRPFSSDYTIVNPIGTLDCLDHAASGTVWGKDDPTRIITVKEYVLDPRKVEMAPPLFRIAGDPTELVVTQVLADALKPHKFTNLYGVPLKVSGGR